MSSTPDLKGQVALVTGASQGLGRAFAKALAAEGTSVAVAARSTEGVKETVRQIKKTGGHARGYDLDVTHRVGIEKTVNAVEHELGSIDLLVNNAGVMAPLGPDWVVDANEWWETFEVNVLGAFLCAQVVLPAMIGRGRGRIINISSDTAQIADGFASAYIASKAALTSWTGSLAQVAKEHGVSVFAYAPRFVRSAITESLAQSLDARQWYGDEFQKIFDDGHDTPLERTVATFMVLASGQTDELSGCHIADADEPKNLLQHMEQIRQENLYRLRLNRLSDTA